MPYKLIGRTTNFKGHRLWEIIGHLKNFGEGRMVIRSRHERYAEPCFYRIVSAKPEMDTGRPHHDEDNTRGHVVVERVFRGRNDGLVNISKAAYKPDFRLIHKHEESKYIEAYRNCKPQEQRIYSRYLDMPPLLKIVAEREGHSKNYLTPKLSRAALKNGRLAEEGEDPTYVFKLGLGEPASPELYEGVL